MRREPERFARGLWLSLALHAGLGAVLLFVPGWFPAYGDASWGSEDAGDGGISVSVVASMSGVSLPSPDVVTPGAIANESAGFYEPEPPTEPEPEPIAEILPETVPDTVPPVEEPPPAPPPPAPRPEPPEAPAAPRPDNAVPFGEGGRPDINYGTSTGGEGVGLEGGGGAFGRQYGAYVEAITRHISQHWLRSMVDTSVTRAPRVYVRFDILRNGAIDPNSIRLERPSGITSLDNSARRAVFAASPLPPLPDAYRGSRVSVQFWFEYTR